MRDTQARAELWSPQDGSYRERAVLAGSAPQLVATKRCYLLQHSTILAPRSVDCADGTLRQLARLATAITVVTVVADITRAHIEDYKVWLPPNRERKGPTMGQKIS